MIFREFTAHRPVAISVEAQNPKPSSVYGGTHLVTTLLGVSLNQETTIGIGASLPDSIRFRVWGCRGYVEI